MDRQNFRIFHSSYLLLLITILLSLIPLKVNAEDLALPNMKINDIKLQNGVTTIDGVITYGTIPKEQISIGLYDSTDQLLSSITPDEFNKWSVSVSTTQKPNTLYVMAYETANPSNLSKINVDVTRPHVDSVYLQYYDVNTPTTPVEFNLLQNEGMSRVLINTTIKIKISDNDSLNNYSEKVNIPSPVTIFDKNFTNIEGTATFDPTTSMIEFQPSQYLLPSMNYFIIFNSSLIPKQTQSGYAPFTDDAGNNVFPIVKKFTTVSVTVRNAVINPDMSSWDQNPHGYYTSNVNTCGNCHGIHVSTKNNLSQPTPDYTPKDTTLDDSYCMACHDGTTVAPGPFNFKTGIISKHDVVPDSEHYSSAGSCTSCHNPHLTWSAENPNFLKDHYVYKHNDNYSDGQIIGEIDSRIQLCEQCHGMNTQAYKNQAEQEAALDKLPAPYRVLHYRKSSSSKGLDSDYDLCFSCHNSTQELKDGTKDILKYYQQTDSMHRLTATDGSQLDGAIPCSECHDTHGSTNLKLLKENIGHENQQSAFSYTSGDWEAKEKEFCIRCHNGSTSIYGVTGKALSEANHPEPLASCKTCHSQSNTIEEVVHSPKPKNVQTP
ncbi:multiheme c-type cytochrome [Bacillus sp. T3]|uniref:multiheme c-type cytochrome n=1 Tax=Bacillus sp. T3 TaxID=467262 RepID=UPI002982347F|nr:cytochrome c3 family protein [Bacillus sp. T3]